MGRGAWAGHHPWGCIELGMTEWLSTPVEGIQLHVGFLEDALEWKFYGGAFPPTALCVNVSRDDPGIQPMFKTYVLSGKGDCFWGVGPGVGRTITFQLTPQMKFTWEWWEACLLLSLYFCLQKRKKHLPSFHCCPWPSWPHVPHQPHWGGM